MTKLPENGVRFTFFVAFLTEVDIIEIHILYYFISTLVIHKPKQIHVIRGNWPIGSEPGVVSVGLQLSDREIWVPI